jgi:DNA polymerase III sliding clamp (beta) subunit (PCNA family)
MAIYQRAALLKIVNTCRPFVAHPIEAINRKCLTHVLFASGAAMATNGTAGIKVFARELDFEDGFSSDCNLLAGLLRRTAAKEVSINRDKSRILLEADRYQFQLETFDKKEFPPFDVPDSREPLDESIWPLTSTVYPYISKDAWKPELCGVLLSDDGFVYATDNFRIARIKHTANIKGVFIPAFLLSKRITQPAPTDYSLTDATVWLWYEDRVVFTRFEQKEPPDFASAFSKWDKATPIAKVECDPDALKVALARILWVVGRSTDVEVALSRSEMRLMATDRACRCEEVVPVRSSGAAKFFINPSQLAGSVNQSNGFVLYNRAVRFTSKVGLDVVLVCR